MTAALRVQIRLPMVADIVALEAWMARAKPGDSTLWASGPTVPRAGAATHLIREWVTAKLVRHEPNQKVDGLWHYRITRLARVQDGAGAPPDPLLQILSDCAARDAVVPTNAELARLIGVHNVSAMRSKLGKLQRDGLVTLEQIPGTGFRRAVVPPPG